jgi:hypothetical protein
MEALIEQQGVRPVIDFDALLGGWPENETVDEFIAAVHLSPCFVSPLCWMSAASSGSDLPVLA